MSEIMARGADTGGAYLDASAARMSAEADAAAEWLERNLARGRSEVFFENVQLTPMMAHALMTLNQGNRRINRQGVARWQRALIEGRWRLNGETLKVSDDGFLNDGQHRLKAVIATGRTAPFSICWGVTRESVVTIDNGTRRKAADAVEMDGHTNGTAKAAAIRLVMNYDGGYDFSRKYEHEEIKAAVAYASADLDLSINAGNVAARYYRQPPSLFIALHYLAARYDRDLTEQFFAALTAGGHDEPGHPIRRLRTRLQENMIGKAKLPMMEVAALVIKSFNAFATGRSVGQLRWFSPEPFPQFLSRPAPRTRR